MTENKTREQKTLEIRDKVVSEFSILSGHVRWVARDAVWALEATSVANASVLKRALTGEGASRETIELLEFAFRSTMSAGEQLDEAISQFRRLQSALNTWNALKVAAPSQFIRYGEDA